MEAINRLREAMPPSAKDIQLNLSSILDGGGASSLDDTQRWGVAVACAIASRNALLRQAVIADASAAVGEAVLDDAHAAATIMAMNNVLYRFRHMVGKESYAKKPARLRMNRMSQPKTNAATFELMSLAVSAINGCAVCIVSHEKAVLERGLTEEHVHEAIRIAATIHAAALAVEIS